MSQKTLHLIANAHLDPVWFWRWPEGLNESIATCRTILDFMDEFPDLKFTRGESQIYQYLEQTSPQIFKRIRHRVEEGRWEVAGGWYNQPDTNLSYDESLLQQAIIGKKYFRRSLGVDPKVAYLVDSFGQCGGLPQILSLSGLSYLAFVRPRKEQLSLPFEVFWWKGEADTKILAARIPMGYLTADDEILRRVEQILEKWPEGLNDWFMLYGLGNHGGGPSRRQIRDILKLRDSNIDVRLHFSTLHEFFGKLAASGYPFPSIEGDLLHHARGCYSANARIKIQAAWLEKHLYRTQAVESVVQAQTGIQINSGDAIDKAWKALLNAQFHDTICGTASVEAYSDAYDEISGAVHDLRIIKNRAAVALSQHIDTRGEGQALIVMNLLPWPVIKTVEAEWMLDYRPVEKGNINVYVEDSDGKVLASQESPTSYVFDSLEWRKKIVFEAELPAMGARVYRLRHADRQPSANLLATPVECDANSLKNKCVQLRIGVDNNSYLLTSQNRSDLSVDIGRLDVFRDISDTWGHDQDCFTDKIGTFEIGRVELIETGPLRGVIRVVSTFGKSQFIQSFILDRNCNYVTCKAELDWKEEHAVGKLVFAPAFECGDFCEVLRPGTWQKHPIGDGEYPGGRMLSVTDKNGNAMVVSCLEKLAYDVYENTLRMTVSRSSIYAWYRCDSPSKPGYYKYMDQGTQSFEYQIFVPQSRENMSEILKSIWQQRYQPHTILSDSHSSDAEMAMPGTLEISPSTLMPWSYDSDGEALLCRLWQSSGVRTKHNIAYKNTKPSQVEVAAGEIVTLKISFDKKTNQTLCEHVGIFSKKG